MNINRLGVSLSISPYIWRLRVTASLCISLPGVTFPSSHYICRPGVSFPSSPLYTCLSLPRFTQYKSPYCAIAKLILYQSVCNGKIRTCQSWSFMTVHINWRDIQRKNVINNVDMSSLMANNFCQWKKSQVRGRRTKARKNKW